MVSVTFHGVEIFKIKPLFLTWMCFPYWDNRTEKVAYVHLVEHKRIEVWFHLLFFPIGHQGRVFIIQ